MGASAAKAAGPRAGAACVVLISSAGAGCGLRASGTGGWAALDPENPVDRVEKNAPKPGCAVGCGDGSGAGCGCIASAVGVRASGSTRYQHLRSLA